MKWTNDKINQLKKLVDKKLSIKEIADIMDTTYSSVEKTMQRRGIYSKYDVNENKKDEKLKVKKEEIAEFMQNLGETVLSTIDEHKIKMLENKRLVIYNPKMKKEQASVLNISDIHIGMINEVFDPKTRTKKITYNYNIFLKELELLKKAIFKFHWLDSKAYTLKTLHLNLLGDIITNDRIFEGQQFHIDRAVGEQVWEGITRLALLINDLKTLYDKILVTGVVGNHGRSTSRYKTDEPVQNNFEWYIYKALKEIYFKKDKQVEINVPTTRETIVEIAGWRHLLEHGDSMRGSSENYIENQIKNLFVNIGEFDIMNFGHFHKAQKTELGDRVLVMRNGCWISKDNYARRVYKYHSTPVQVMYGQNPKRRITWIHEIDLSVDK